MDISGHGPTLHLVHDGLEWWYGQYLAKLMLPGGAQEIGELEQAVNRW